MWAVHTQPFRYFLHLCSVATQYAIRADWPVNLKLTSKNALTPINTNSSYSTYPYYIGLGLGLRYRF